MSPATPIDGGDPTPMAQPILITCPHCGKAIPPIVGPVPRYAALERKPQAVEPPPFPTRNDRGYAPTERMDMQDPEARS